MHPQRLFIVDAMALAFRSFYALGARPLTTSTGLPTSSVFASAIFLTKLLSEMQPDYVVVATDSAEPTFRHRLYPAYKANRSEMPEDLATQLPHFFRLIDAMGFKLLKQGGFEADDLIGTVARRFAGPDCHVYIVSGDKDFCQLVNDHVSLYIPKKGEDALVLDRRGVQAKFGVNPEQVIDTLAIIGDTSDNVPGVRGIGEKGAAKLINDYGSLDGIYAHLQEIANKKQKTALEEHRETAYLSRQLVTIHTDCPLDFHLEAFRCDPPTSAYNAAVLSLYQELEFRGLSAKVDAMLKSRGQSPEEPLASPTPEAPVVEKPADGPRVAPDQVAGYRVVQTAEDLALLVALLRDAPHFAFDTETTGLDPVQDQPIGMSFAVRSGEAFYVPLAKLHRGDLAPQEILAALSPILASPQLKIGHNIKFDLEMLRNIGVTVHGPFADTMIMDWLLESTGRGHGLDAACLRHLNYQKIPTSQLMGKNGENPMIAVDLGELTRYACEDADLTFQLYQALLPKLEIRNLTTALATVEMPLVPILAKMEQTGIFVDRDALAAFSRRLTTMVADLEERIYQAAEGEFNINSPKQLAEILFVRLKIHEQLGIKSIKKTKTGYSTDESVLQKLAAHPLPTALLEYRTVTKLKGTYVDSLPRLIHPRSGRVHTSYHQTGTATGRLSSSDPNLQNIPIRGALGREIRRAFRPSSPDWVMVSADYSQVELRILAHMAHEESLAEAFRNGADIHRATAAKIFGVDPAQVDSDMRSKAKAINFGIIYGMGPKRLAAETGVTQAEAKDFIDRYFESYPGINRFITSSIESARDLGYATTITGRRRPIPGLLDKNPGLVVNAENIAVNTPIQGSAADLIKLAMIRIDAALEASHLRARLLLQVHDELVFEAARDDADALAQLVRECMTKAMELTVPLEVEVGIGPTWLEAH